MIRRFEDCVCDRLRKDKTQNDTHITAGNIVALIVAIWIVGVTDARVAAACQFSFLFLQNCIIGVAVVARP